MSDTNPDATNSGDEVNLAINDWSVSADNNVSIVASGDSIYIGGQGDSTCLLMDATDTASICCGPAQLVLTSMEGGIGNIAMTTGTEGSIQLLAGPPEEGSYVSMNAEEFTLQLGVVDVGALIQMTPESIKISVGPSGSGASIEITPESITLKVAEVTLTLSPEGITEDVAEVTREMTAEGHNFTAAETELNVGVEGIVTEAPTKEEEYEAGTVENETLGSDTTDAAKNEDAAIIITE